MFNNRRDCHFEHFHDHSADWLLFGQRTLMFDRYRLHHVGVICPSLEGADTFMATMGLKEDYRSFVDRWHCLCIFTKPANGGTAIELIVAVDGPLLRFNKGAGGVHHFAFEVSDILAAMKWVESQGMLMIESEPIKGAGDFWCNFLTLGSTKGVQIELVEPFR
jgi:methylmalonyl-CoA/ethylmalonyl-CoA epimerase